MARDLEDLDQDDYMKIVLAEMHDKATEPQAEALRQDREAVREWQDALKELKGSIESKLATMKAQLGAFEQLCRQEGKDGKDKFFRHRVAQDAERARLIGFKRLVEHRMREAKGLIREFGDEDGSFTNRLDLLVTSVQELKTLVVEALRKIL
jgi:small-conductance mechanosensitive channel